MPDVLSFSLKQCSLMIFIFQKYETASFEKNYYTGEVQRVGFYKSLVGARSWLVSITLTFNSSPNFMNKRNMRWFLMLNQNFCITYLNLQVSVHDIFFSFIFNFNFLHDISLFATFCAGLLVWAGVSTTASLSAALDTFPLFSFCGYSDYSPFIYWSIYQSIILAMLQSAK